MESVGRETSCLSSIADHFAYGKIGSEIRRTLGQKIEHIVEIERKHLFEKTVDELLLSSNSSEVAHSVCRTVAHILKSLHTVEVALSCRQFEFGRIKRLIENNINTANGVDN